MWSSADVLPRMECGQLFVVSAPAGTGKNTLVNKLLAEFPLVIQESISCTTRKPRAGEIDGVHYHFLDKEIFHQRVADGDFLEYAEVFGNYYGTSRSLVEKLQRGGIHVVLVIDTQGALEMMKSIDATYIFIMPPSIEELRRRLMLRNTESNEERERRLSWAEREINAAVYYDYLVVNQEIDTAYEVMRSIVIAETHRNQSKKFIRS
jgi:guanylate kinase